MAKIKYLRIDQLEKLWKIYHLNVLMEKSEKDRNNEIYRWINHISIFFSYYKISELDNMSIMQLKKSLFQKKLSKQTVCHCLSLLRRVLNYSKKLNYWDGQLPQFDMPKLGNTKRLRFLSKLEAAKLLGYLKKTNTKWYHITLIALSTGLRKGEIYKLTASDIQLQNNLLVVADSKNGTSRQIPISDNIREILKDYQENTKTGFLFGSCNCMPFRRAVEACGLNQGVKDVRYKIVFHSLRHTFASWLVQANTSLQVVSQLLGHSNLTMTMRYAHLAPEQANAAIDALNLNLNLI
jgi:integrase